MPDRLPVPQSALVILALSVLAWATVIFGLVLIYRAL